MGFSRQENWSFPGKLQYGLPFPPPGDLPDPGIELASLMSPVPLSHLGSPAPTQFILYRLRVYTCAALEPENEEWSQGQEECGLFACSVLRSF